MNRDRWFSKTVDMPSGTLKIAGLLQIVFTTAGAGFLFFVGDVATQYFAYVRGSIDSRSIYWIPPSFSALVGMTCVFMVLRAQRTRRLQDAARYLLFYKVCELTAGALGRVLAVSNSCSEPDRREVKREEVEALVHGFDDVLHELELTALR